MTIRQRPRRFDLNDPTVTWTPEVTRAEIGQAVKDLFNGVASDLGVLDFSDDAFLDFACDRLSDHRVPPAVVEQVELWLVDGAQGDFR